MKKNIEFWHSYPEMMVRDLTAEQLCWQPDGHDSTVAFALWHTYRAADELVHGMVAKKPSVHSSGDWATRLGVPRTGVTPFGNGATREQIAAVRPDVDALCAYAKAVGAAIGEIAASMSEAEAAEMVELPFFASVYPGYERMSKLDTITFFAIGHTCEHLGEVQMLRGLMGLKGAPL